LFYPAGLAARNWFSFYASVFETVEVNNTFYRIPAATTAEAWGRQAPEGFVYALKAPQLLTHQRDGDPTEVLSTFLERAQLLGDHLGPILYQFPPGRRCDLPWLSSFLDLLPTGFHHVVEFRHRSWYVEEVREVLARQGVGFCVHDMHRSAAPPWVTGPVAYVRFHGPSAVKYTGRYGSARLGHWADQLDAFVQDGRDVFAFFNNTAQAAAVPDARELRALLGQGRPAAELQARS